MSDKISNSLQDETKSPIREGMSVGCVPILVPCKYSSSIKDGIRVLCESLTMSGRPKVIAMSLPKSVSLSKLECF